MESKKISEIAKEGLKGFLEDYNDMLFDGLLKDGIIESRSNNNSGDKIYQLVQTVQDKIVPESAPINNKDNNLIKSYLEFRELLINVYQNLDLPNSQVARNIPFVELVTYFESLEVLSIFLDTSDRLKTIFNFGEQLINDEEIRDDAIKLFTEYNFNFRSYTNRLLGFYLLQRAQKYFRNFSFHRDHKIEDEVQNRISIDLAGNNSNPIEPDLLFESKYRVKAMSTLKENLFQAYETLMRYNSISNKENYQILVIFTQEDGDFEKFHYKFNQNLEALFPEQSWNIFFVVVSIFRLHLIDSEFKRINIIEEVNNFDWIRFIEGKWILEYRKGESAPSFEDIDIRYDGNYFIKGEPIFELQNRNFKPDERQITWDKVRKEGTKHSHETLVIINRKEIRGYDTSGYSLYYKRMIAKPTSQIE